MSGCSTATRVLGLLWRSSGTTRIRSSTAIWRISKDSTAIFVGIIVTRGTTLQDELKTLVRGWLDQVDADSFEELARYGLQPTSRPRREVMKRVQRYRDPVSFRQAWVDHFVADKFGAATMHWRKLDDRVGSGSGIRVRWF